MDTLIGEYKIRLNLLDQKVHEIIKSGEWKTHPQFTEQDLKLKEHLESFNTNLIKSKDFKFERDRTAFLEGRAYRWPIMKHNLQNRPFRSNFNRTRGGHISDSSGQSGAYALPNYK